MNLDVGVVTEAKQKLAENMGMTQMEAEGILTWSATFTMFELENGRARWADKRAPKFKRPQQEMRPPPLLI